MRIVFDTSCLITALRSSGGAAAEILRLVAHGDLVLLMDLKLSYEYKTVATRPEHLAASRMSVQRVERALQDLEDLAEDVLVLTKIRPLSADPDDDMVLDVAINGKADVIVTQNAKHFREAGQQFNIPVLSPLQLLQVLREKE